MYTMSTKNHREYQRFWGSKGVARTVLAICIYIILPCCVQAIEPIRQN